MREFKITNYSVSGKEAFFYAFTIIILSFIFVFSDVFETWEGVVLNLVNTIVILGLSFLFHHLLQKAVAQAYGARTEYVLWIPGVIIAIAVGLVSLGKIPFFLLGITSVKQYYGSRLGKKSVKLGEDERGKIILSGSLASLSLAFIIKLLSPFLNESVWILGVTVNLLFAVYNLIPIPPLSGSFVFMWSRVAWAVTLAVSLISLFMMPVVSVFWVAVLAGGLGLITFLFMLGYNLA